MVGDLLAQVLIAQCRSYHEGLHHYFLFNVPLLWLKAGSMAAETLELEKPGFNQKTC